MNELTLKFEEELSKNSVLILLRNALQCYQFINEDKLNDFEMNEIEELLDSVYSEMNNSDYHVSSLLNDQLNLQEPVYQNEGDDGFIEWMIENGHIQLNDDGTVTLPEPDEEFKQEQQEKRNKYQETQKHLSDYIRSNYDKEQLHWMRVMV